jgi:hypothetical protein
MAWLGKSVAVEEASTWSLFEAIKLNQIKSKLFEAKTDMFRHRYK